MRKESEFHQPIKPVHGISGSIEPIIREDLLERARRLQSRRSEIVARSKEGDEIAIREGLESAVFKHLLPKSEWQLK